MLLILATVAWSLSTMRALSAVAALAAGPAVALSLVSAISSARLSVDNLFRPAADVPPVEVTSFAKAKQTEQEVLKRPNLPNLTSRGRMQPLTLHWFI